MKRIALSILSLAMVATTATAQKLDRSVRPKPGPAPEIQLGKSESFTLSNGMRVFVVENHKLPTISASIQLDIKPALEGDMAGYREMMSELLTSGTKTRSKDQLDREIDFIGARIGASDESIYANGLKKHQDKLFELMSDIAMNAVIKESELEKTRKRSLSALKAGENEPDEMLNNVSAVLNFSRQHPYGEVATEETVNNITLEQCQKYYNTYFRPNVAYMAIVGDITVAEAKPLVEKYFGKWQKADVPVAKYSEPTAPKGAQVAFVPRDAAVQSVINVTYPIDLEPGSPDVIKAKVANAILGGGSQGRLFLNLREKHGWTYGSYSTVDADDLEGYFSAYAKCRNAVSDSSVAEILEEMKRLNTQKVSEEELRNRIAYMSGAFAIGLENPATVAQYAINIERYNMPKDYYQNYLKNLNAVTANDVMQVSKQYINPKNAYIVVVGSKDDVAKTLTQFDTDGNLDYYDNYGQPIKPAQQAAAPSGMTADDVMKKYITAIGGEKAIRNIKDIKTVSSGTFNVGGQEIPLTITEIKKAPSSMMTLVEGMGMTLNKSVYNGTTGYMQNPQGKQDMDADMLATTRAEADIYADLTPEKYGIKRTLKGVESVNGNEVYVVEKMDGDKKSMEYYDKNSNLLVKTVETEETPSGTATTVTEYSDYKEVPGTNGYKVPYTIKQVSSAGGQSQEITAKVDVVEINKGIADSEFN